MFIRSKLVFVPFIALMLTYIMPTTIESRAVAQLLKQSRTDVDQQAIVQAYRIMALGFKNKDLDQIFYSNAPEFIQIEKEQVVNLDQCRQAMLSDLKTINQVVFSNYNFEQIQVDSSTATVLGSGHVSVVTVRGIPLSIVFKFEDTWKLNMSGVWKVTSTRIFQRDIKIEIDNQPSPLYYRNFGGNTSPVSPR